MRLGVPLGAGRIGKWVRIPRGRATVKIVGSVERRCKSQETCPDAVAAFERPRKGVQAAGISLFPEKIPSPACRLCATERVTGFVFSISQGSLKRRNFSAPSLRALRLRGEPSVSKTHCGDAEDAEVSQKTRPLVASHHDVCNRAELFVL